MITTSTRPIYAFAIGRDWTAYRGDEQLAPARPFAWDAINDLPPEAGVTPRAGGYSCVEPYRVVPSRNEHAQAVWPHWEPVRRT